ncbi:MAG TPA: transglycosylase domain-containing protein, partial [Cytophagaceae bacterium]
MRNLFVQWQYDKIVRASYAIFASVVINFVYFTFLVQINFLWLFGTMPGINHLENPKSDLASELYSADNVLLGKYFRENRSPVNYEEISPNVIETLIITEDQRFYEHSGIDLKGALAIFWYMLKGDPRGGSTITQQLAKNLFKTRVETSKGGLGYIPGVSVLIAKVKEWILAVRLEKNFTKEELLTMYLNTVDFGSNSFGIKVAARTFFNTSPDSLTYPQSAVLIGLLKAPTSYSPVLNPEKSKERRNVLLHLLFQAGKISQSEYKEMIKQDLGLDYKVENHTDGLATYFRSTVSKYLLNWCKSNGKDLYADGLKIYTTIDATIQKHAEDAMQEHMKQLQSKFYVHWKGRNPWIYENGKEIPRFIEDVARRTEGYRKLKAKYGENNDSIDIIMNTPVKMTVFSWDGDIDT